jgi:hypothetical protein
MVILCSFGCVVNIAHIELSPSFSLFFFAPNYGEGNDTKKMPIMATFLCRSLQIRVTEGLQIRRLHNHEVQIRTSRNSTTRRPIRHIMTHHGSTSTLLHITSITISSSATCSCYNQRAKATALILTAMHLQTPNCLPVRLIIS